MAHIMNSAPVALEVVGSSLEDVGYLNVLHVSPTIYKAFVARRGHVNTNLQDSRTTRNDGVLVCINGTSTFYAWYVRSRCCNGVV